MIISRLLLVLLAVSAVALSACGPGDSSGGGDAGQPGDAENVDINALIASADLKRGETLFLQCRACHSLGEGEANKVGPNLHGVFGRKAGLAPEFAFSEVFVNADVTWTPETMSEFLYRPSAFLPGNRMVFIGVGKPADRANLIAFLQQATAAD